MAFLSFTKYVFNLLFLMNILNGFAAPYPFIRGVTYFGDASPTTFWNSNLDRVEQDFKELQADGFNSIVLVVPWGEFQPSVIPARHNQDAFNRLKRVCETAKDAGLSVFIRASYLWDFYPDVQMPNFQRANSLLTDDKLMPAWRDYLQRIGTATQNCSQGYFISWEDFWFLMEVVAFDKKASKVAKLARERSFDQWARMHAGSAFLKKYASIALRTGRYPIPDRSSPEFEQLLRWFNDQLTGRLLPTVSKILPSTSMEVRSDADPVFNNGKLLHWYSHKKTYSIKSSPYVMTYWAPAIGAKNEGDVESARKVLNRFVYVQEGISAHTSNRIFIEQFLFKDSTPEAHRNTQIAPDQISEFLRDVAQPMMKLTGGYALWGSRDYSANLLFNGQFSVGSLGWATSKSETINIGSAVLTQGLFISQLVPVLRGNSPGETKNTTLRIRLNGEGKLKIEFADSVQYVSVNKQSREISLNLPLALRDSELKLTSESGTIRVSDVRLYFYQHVSEVRDSDGKPAKHLDDIRSLNRSLSKGAGIPSRLSANDDSLAQASGVHGRERDGTRWFVWSKPHVEAQLFAAGNSLLVRGYMRPSMFKHQKSCTFVAKVDGQTVAKQTYRDDGPIEIRAKLSKVQPATLVDVHLSSTCSSHQQTRKPGADGRNLSFVLNDLAILADGN